MARYIGITGGIGTGKSTVCGFLREFGARIIDADRIAKEIIRPGGNAYQRVIARFGSGILDEAGVVDRKALGRIIFEDSAAREDLNSITHPAIKAEVDSLFADYAREGDCVVVLEAPLLFEAGMEDTVDEVWVVACGQAEQLRRVMARGFTRDEAMARIDSQMPLAEKIARADRVIFTDGAKSATRAVLLGLWLEICPPQKAGEDD